VGNGAPLCLKKDSNVEFDAKADGANRFLKKGAQSAHFGPNRDQADFAVILANFSNIGNNHFLINHGFNISK